MDKEHKNMNRLWITFRYSLRSFRGQILGWGLGIGALGLLLVSFYDVFAAQQSDFMQMIEAYPPEFLAFFGGDAASLATPSGFLGMYGFAMLPLVIGFFGLLAGSGLVAADEERGRLDLILAHPVGRAALFAGRVLGFISAAVLVVFLGWLGFSILLDSSSLGVSWGQMALPFLPLLAQGLLYGSLALLLSLLLPSRAQAAMLTGLVLVSSYLLTSLSSIASSLETAARLLPNAYYQGGDALNGLNLAWFLGLLAVSLVFFGLAWWRFQTRDIRLSGEGSWKMRGWIPRRRRQVDLPQS
jgi:ABC-2 type transport system permease protein